MNKKGGIFKRGLVIFTEGPTDKIFYKALVEYIMMQNSLKNRVDVLEIVDLGGIGNFSRKLIGIFKSRILIKNKDTKFTVICTYDTDVFELATKPPVNWTSVRKELRSLGALKVIEIKATRMIEDWFLFDTMGLCKFLGIGSVTPKGKDGNEKMKFLFRKANRVYTKGSECGEFIKDLNFKIIHNCLQKEVAQLSIYLFK